jgi:hypothetical protein
MKPFNRVDQVNYRVQKSWKAVHFVMRVLKKVNKHKTFQPTCDWKVLFLNVGLHAEMNAVKDREMCYTEY